MEKLEVRPHENANDRCLVCHRELTLVLPSTEDKVHYADDLNKQYKLGLEPADIMLLGKPCQCGGQGTQVFYKPKWEDLK